IRALKSVRMTGTIRAGSGDRAFDLRYGEIDARGRVRVETTFQGLTAVDAWDGKRAWSTAPFEGRRDAFLQSEDDAKSIARQADLDGRLVDWKSKGHRVDYMGTEEIDGTVAHKLRIKLADGNVEYHYLDPDAFLDIRVVHEDYVRGTQQVRETDLGNYEEVA